MLFKDGWRAGDALSPSLLFFSLGLLQEGAVNVRNNRRGEGGSCFIIGWARSFLRLVCDCRELLTVTDARITVLKQCGSFSLPCRKPGCGQSRAGGAATPSSGSRAPFFLLHHPVPCGFHHQVLGTEGPLEFLWSQPHTSQEAGGKGRPKSTCQLSSAQGRASTSYLTCLCTAPWPHRAAKRARKCSLLSGHIESRIKSEFVTKEEGRIDISWAASHLCHNPGPLHPDQLTTWRREDGWTCPEEAALPGAGYAGAQGASRSFTTVTCVCTCVPGTGPRRTQPCP